MTRWKDNDTAERRRTNRERDKEKEPHRAIGYRYVIVINQVFGSWDGGGECGPDGGKKSGAFTFSDGQVRFNLAFYYS